MAAKKYKEPKCSFSLADCCVKTDGKIHNKVTGTAMAGILGLSPFNTPFQQACALLGVCREDLDGTPAIEIGKALEEKIIEYIGERYPEYGMFVPCKDLPDIEKRKGDHETWGSDFDDLIFGGHIDGMVYDQDLNDYILEIKTTSNYKSWSDGVPEYYKLQVMLYNHFMTKRDKAYVAVALVNGVTKATVSEWTPTDDNVFLFQLPINDEEFEKTLTEVKHWYEDYILQGVTPPYDPQNKGDVEMWQHLATIVAPADDIQDAVDRLEEVNELICASEEKMKPLTAERDELRKKIKDYMVNNKKDNIATTSGKFAAVISESCKRSIDPDLLEDDGIDPEKYTVMKVTKTLSFKPVKEEDSEEEE